MQTVKGPACLCAGERTLTRPSPTLASSQLLNGTMMVCAKPGLSISIELNSNLPTIAANGMP